MKWDSTKALKNTVVLLSGDEYVLRGRALTDLIQTASAGDDFDLETFVGDSSTPTDWFASAGTTPFLSPRRTVVVRNLGRNETHKEFKIPKLPESSLVILVMDEEQGDSDKQRKLENARKGWEAAVKSGGGDVWVFKTDPKDVIPGIKAEAERLEKKINERAAETLREMTGGNLSRAQEELEKLAIFSAGPQITEQDVKTVTVASPEWNIYKMVDAISRGDSGEVLRHLRIIMGANNKVEDISFRIIIPTITSQLRSLWQARICVEAKCDPANMPSDLLALMPGRPNLANDPDWKQRKMMQLARNMSFPFLAACFQAVSDCDARLKGQLASFSGIESLERMVLEMTQAAGAGQKTARY
ncbi:MAG TPA: DNA polymerase III subunit delta [Fimbriimonadaceae bacterium]|jgi:DNA polymerase III delta subunit